MKAPSYDTCRSCLGEVLPIDTPFRLTLDSSEACNFKCSYCFRSTQVSEAWGYAAKNGIMSMEVFKKAAQQIMNFPTNPRVISLSGMGEPLCNKNIPLMVQYLKAIGITSKVEMHTNAALLTKKSAAEVAVCGIDKLVVSIQGLTAETYKQVCEFNINYNEFVENLEILYANKRDGMEINIKIVDVALDSPEEEQQFYERFSAISDKIFVEKTMGLWQEQMEYDDEANTQFNKYGKDYGDIECCPIAFLNLTVSPDGDIYPCCVINPPFALGNLAEIELVEAWNHPHRTEFLRNILMHGRKCHTRCETCYFPKGYVKTELDIIDSYRSAILERIY